jgi:hypothetical protein
MTAPPFVGVTSRTVNKPGGELSPALSDSHDHRSKNTNDKMDKKCTFFILYKF